MPGTRRPGTPRRAHIRLPHPPGGSRAWIRRRKTHPGHQWVPASRPPHLPERGRRPLLGRGAPSPPARRRWRTSWRGKMGSCGGARRRAALPRTSSRGYAGKRRTRKGTGGRRHLHPRRIDLAHHDHHDVPKHCNTIHSICHLSGLSSQESDQNSIGIVHSPANKLCHQQNRTDGDGVAKGATQSPRRPAQSAVSLARNRTTRANLKVVSVLVGRTFGHPSWTGTV